MTTKTTNAVQALNLALIRTASFNEFDGDRVADSLLAHKDLWKAVIMDRADYYYDRSDPKEGHQEPVDLIKLRDIADGYWNVDTIYLLAEEGREDDLEALAHDWDADEIGWMQNSHVGRYLRVWWD